MVFTRYLQDGREGFSVGIDSASDLLRDLLSTLAKAMGHHPPADGHTHADSGGGWQCPSASA